MWFIICIYIFNLVREFQEVLKLSLKCKTRRPKPRIDSAAAIQINNKANTWPSGILKYTETTIKFRLAENKSNSEKSKVIIIVRLL